jgi:ketosteroid isomerase-like protein
MPANLDLVRSIYADWERGDFSSAAWAHPEIEFVIADGPSPGRWKGVAAMARAWRDFVPGLEDLRTHAESYQTLDGERVLVVTRYGGRGKTSGVGVETHGAILFHLGEGRVTRLVRYWDRDRALADLGLEEE